MFTNQIQKNPDCISSGFFCIYIDLSQTKNNIFYSKYYLYYNIT